MLAVLEAPQLYAWMYIRVDVYMYRIEIIGAAGVKKRALFKFPLIGYELARVDLIRLSELSR